ncbi:hypothetical protein QCC53_28750, partial [Pseudomonas aeruginosa]|nr:hypothetical protein [Pseudomonas aeruginosa]
MSRIDTPPGFAVYPSASPKAANLPAVDQVLAFEQALGGEPPAAGRRRWRRPMPSRPGPSGLSGAGRPPAAAGPCR